MADFNTEVPVLIVGGGPVGLTLALELHHQGVSAMLVERNTETTQHPKMDITNARSMEIYRRLGYADELRRQAIPDDHSMSVVWATDLAGWELARFDYPSVAEMKRQIEADETGALPLEPPMRISQAILEPAIKQILERDAADIDLKFGWKLISFETDVAGVTSIIANTETGERKTVRSEYLAGCDGAGSRVRRGLGIEIETLPIAGLAGSATGLLKTLRRTGVQPWDGRLYVIHFETQEKAKMERFGTAWHLQFPNMVTLIGQDDVETYTAHIPMYFGQDVDAIDPHKLLQEALGQTLDVDILIHNVWEPQLGLATSYGRGRVWLAGDSAHQVIPTGGYGMNTGVGDAAALGWKIGAILKGWGGGALLDAYEAERRPVAVRNRLASGAHTEVRLKISQEARPAIHKPRGDAAREMLGAYIENMGNLENEAAGIEFGYIYENSPIICHEAGVSRDDVWDEYVPSTRPGVRPPSVSLENGTALFDQLNSRGFTLLRFAKTDVSGFETAARAAGMPLKLIDIDDMRIHSLYEKNLVLIRPDQHVAWRADDLPEDPAAIIDIVRGAA